jgi:hypothetical protein
MVKVTETYNPTTKVAEDKTLEVVFTRTTNTQTTELQTGMDTYVATADDITIERLTDEPGRVVIKNVANHEFRALNGEIVLQNWTSSNQETLEFLFTKLETGTFTKIATAPDLDINALIQPDSPAGQIILTNNPDYEFRLMNGETELVEWENYPTDNTITFEFDDELTPTIEARGIDATIIFDAIQGLTYDVTLGGVPVSSDITDNGNLDENLTAAMITISGLTEGLTYDIAFEGQLPDAALTDITIESRSTNASISFTAFEGFTYAIKTGENTLLSNVVDNDTNDINEKEGVITIDGLTEGMPYEAHYSGYVVIETITQDEVDGQVDKLFVLYEYTFISFVPLNLNQRPNISQLVKDYDRVPMYDKTGFYSDSTRQSFVVDNDTGYIYKIENIQISNLSGGCVSLKDNPYPFDMRINEENELEFYSLYQNPSIITNVCVKDKYGNKYIGNNFIEQIDNKNNSLYYISNPEGSGGTNTKYTYFLTSTGEVVIKDQLGMYRVVLADRSNRSINSNDNFEIFVSRHLYRHMHFVVINNPTSYPGQYVVNTFQPKVFVKNNLVKEHIGLSANFDRPEEHSKFDNSVWNSVKFTKYCENEIYIYTASVSPYDTLNYSGYSYLNWVSNHFYFDKYGISIYFGKNYDDNQFSKVTYFTNLFELFEGKMNTAILGNDYTTLNNTNTHHINQTIKTFNYAQVDYTNEVKTLPELDGGIMIDNKIQKVTLNGNVTYDLIPEKVNDNWTIKAYVTGTYIAPPPTTVTFQPINK